ncbi:hypothetical protein D3C81_1947280 [compost metagenome]
MRLFNTPTDTVKVAVRVPYSTVMVATPVPIPVTRPLVTSAMVASLVLHFADAVTSD